MSIESPAYDKLVGRLSNVHSPQLPMASLQSTINDDEISESTKLNEEELSDGRRGRSKARNKNPASRIPRPSSFLFKGTGKKSKGHRMSRRYENAMYLATYVAETEEDFYNFDVIPEHNNAFTRLLHDPKQLQVWQEFLELTGDEQDRIIFTEVESCTQEEVHSKVPETASIRATADKNKVEVMNMKSEKNNQESVVVAKEIGYLLKRHNPPLDTLKCIEDELRDLFSQDSNTVLVYMETSR
ncbi:R3H domain-containing protein 4-like [Oopsacas minuta]|uniref:R3H domain-containing protein 4-like n=1 Tax=Oopsacas minuta TaxID=111878 RepID=A0AAV7JLU9_9METZ|nr:R3H domain-containing protein 4-like [Oopsacas minuta]